MAEGKYWKAISRFESHDFVANWYRKAHERDANAAKVGQINACFAHGREYFRNAGHSDMSVKPLLLYYGILSCCRGVILANNPEKKEKSLKPRHGLETVDWQHMLSGGIRSVLELGIRATDGTFGELVDVCWHKKTLHSFNGPTNELVSRGQPFGDVRFATDGSEMTLADLLSRLLQTGLAYPELTGRRANMFGGARIVSHPPGVHLAFPLVGIPDELKSLADGQNIYVGSVNLTMPLSALKVTRNGRKSWQRGGSNPCTPTSGARAHVFAGFVTHAPRRLVRSRRAGAAIPSPTRHAESS